MLLSTSAAVSESYPKVRATFQVERLTASKSEFKPKYGEKVLISVFIPIWNRKVC